MNIDLNAALKLIETYAVYLIFFGAIVIVAIWLKKRRNQPEKKDKVSLREDYSDKLIQPPKDILTHGSEREEYVQKPIREEYTPKLPREEYVERQPEPKRGESTLIKEILQAIQRDEEKRHEMSSTLNKDSLKGSQVLNILKQNIDSVEIVLKNSEDLHPLFEDGTKVKVKFKIIDEKKTFAEPLPKKDLLEEHETAEKEEEPSKEEEDDSWEHPPTS